MVLREGRAEEVRFVEGAVSDAQFEEEAASDYQAMIDASRAASARILFVAYPIEKGAFQTANRAVRRVAEHSDAPVLEAGESVRRVPLEQRQLLWGAHPNGAMYAEIARDLVPAVVDGALAVQRSAPASTEPLARMTFAAEEGHRAGECPLETTACAGEATCYRWNPNGTVCNVEKVLTRRQVEVRASWRMRVASPPNATQGTDVFSLIEKAYGIGLRVEFADPEHLRIASVGSGEATAVCGPLASRVAGDTWYTIHVNAKKGDAGTVTLELADEAGRTIGSLSCDAQPLGGGAFTHAVVGGGNTFGATADILFGDVEILGPSS